MKKTVKSSDAPKINSTDRPYPIEYTLSAIEGRWKIMILYLLGLHKVMRYGELKKQLPGITHKMLSTSLKELVAYDVIIRKQYLQIPPKVEYRLSDKGESLIPVLQILCEWGKKNNPQEFGRS